VRININEIKYVLYYFTSFGEVTSTLGIWSMLTGRFNLGGVLVGVKPPGKTGVDTQRAIISKGFWSFNDGDEALLHGMNFFTFFRNDFDLGLCIGLHSLHFSAAMIKSGSLFERFATFLLPPKRQRLSFVNFAISSAQSCRFVNLAHSSAVNFLP